MVPPRLPALAALALLGAACGSAPRAPVPEEPAAPRPPADHRPADVLVLDLGRRADHDLSALVGQGDEPPLYELLRRPDGRVLRALGADGPREIRLVRAGEISRLALIEAGQLDAADLHEGDLVGHLADPGTTQVHFFLDFERIVLRLGPRMGAAEREGLWQTADRVSLAEVLFPRTGRPALGCLPGVDEPEPALREGVLPGGPVALLAEKGRPEIAAVARRVAAAWSAGGVSARVESVSFAVLRDRMLTGRFDAAVLGVDRPIEPSGRAEPGIEAWVCPGAPPGRPAIERWLRDSCGVFPLVSLDRIVAVRPDLVGVAFDSDGRIRWDRVAKPEGT
jgi:hypothetical protein